MFAFFGQTYQTGTDPWQLFALWAALTLTLCLGVRHSVLWMAWVMVALTAAELYAQVQTSRLWWWSDSHISLVGSLGAWLPALLLALTLVPTQLTGAGACAAEHDLRDDRTRQHVGAHRLQGHA